MAKYIVATNEKENHYIDMTSVSEHMAARAIRAREITSLVHGILLIVLSVLIVSQIICNVFFETFFGLNIATFIIGMLIVACGMCIQFHAMDDANSEYYEMSKLFLKYGALTLGSALCFIYIF